ncbi:MAG: phosphate ABC transporter permease PstA [Myxococcota bacterium]|nr:phosphate ABC transporter permease PstA [Myxococcota bacterium]
MSQAVPTPDLVALRRGIRRRVLFDKLFSLFGWACLAVGLLTLAALLVDLAVDGLPHLRWDFFTSFPSRKAERAGILSAWVGTVAVMIVTGMAAIPLGVAAAVYLEEYGSRNWVNDIIEISVTNLAGVPSIVFGLLALGFFIYAMDLGRSVLTGGLTLAILVLPIVIVATREALRAVPFGVREAAFALGATKWQTVWHHVLPYSLGGVATGVIIALARAIGETAPLITIGALTYIAFLPTSPIQSQPPFVSFQWTDDPFTVLPIQMFNWISRPGDDFQGNAAAAGLVLLVMTLMMNGGAIWLRYRLRKRIRW